MTITAIKLEIGKMITALIPAGYFIWTGEMHFAITTFILLLTLDTVTGITKSTKLFCGGFCSNKLVNMRKLICYMIAILLAYLLTTLPHFEGSFIYVVAWFSLREAWSIVENLSDMGLQFPQHIIKRVAGELNKCDDKCEK